MGPTRSENGVVPLKLLPDETLIPWVPDMAGVQSLQSFVKDGAGAAASLNSPFLTSCLHPHRVSRADEGLSPLLHANAELQAEQASLLLRNSELVSQTLLLKLQNQRLKQQLETQLQNRESAFSSSVSSSGSSVSFEIFSTDSEDEEEVDVEVAMCSIEGGLWKMKLDPGGIDDAKSP